ncbi:MAG: peptide ABC transporter substrate-binding protein [Defluviitaleaceae bacterium]|nr:peptide ABC transporter substrate-binding protein [Defluviitaleaceae bacterium]
MKKLLALMLVAVFIFAACTPSAPAVPDATTTPGTTTAPGATGTTTPADTGALSSRMHAVQELHYLYSSEIATMNYLLQSAEVTFAAAAQFVDGLIEFNRYGVVIPNIAHSWGVSDDGLVWTFHLRDDVTWVDWQGNFVAYTTAHDFVSTAQWVLNQDNASVFSDRYFNFFVGAQEYFDSTGPDWTGPPVDFSTVGVRAIDDWTLEYTLLQPTPFFETMVAWVAFYPVYGPFLEEMGDRFGTSNDTILYNGAMRMEEWSHQNRRVYVRNESYYLAHEIHIERITWTFNAEHALIAPEMFRRGELTHADINTIILEEWLADPNLAHLVRPNVASWFSFFYIFNFDPQFPDQYEPENWRLAVNNRNFRKAMFHAFDRMAAVYTSDPFFPENHLIETITPPGFVTAPNGVDFTQTGELGRLSRELPGFDENLAAQYRDAARAELEAAGATFPIRILMPYNSNSPQWGQRSQVVKQNLERILGSDFIDVRIYDASPTDFLGQNRRNGRFAFLEANWGGTIGDPIAYTGPFDFMGTYNQPHMVDGYRNAAGEFIYQAILDEAIAELTDIQRRFELFAEAEAFLIEEAFVMPYVRSVPMWVASYIDPFQLNRAPANPMSIWKWNNVYRLDAPMDRDQFDAGREIWLAETEAARAAAAR